MPTDSSRSLEEGDLHHRRGGRFPWWTKSFLVDWALYALLFAVTAGVVGSDVVEPFHRYQVPNDPTTAYPLLPSIVPSWAAALMATLIPAAIFVLMQLWPTRTWHRAHDVHHGLLTLLAALCHAFVFTDVLKLYAGRLRPDFQARAAAPMTSDVVDGMQSFPSGHSSTMFAGMSVLSWYLAGKFGTFTKHGGHALRVAGSLWPLWIAAFVAVSRTRDYHHNFSDILAGTLIGLVAGTVAYFSYWHGPAGDEAGQPKQRSATF